jgi:N-acetylneuraminic acid mutarotase
MSTILIKLKQVFIWFAGLEDKDMQFDSSWLQSKPLFREVWKYNYARQKWQRMDIENIPLVLASNAVALQGKILMVYGGTGVPFGGHCSNELFICDLSQPVLRFDLVLVSGNKPEPQYGQAIFLKDSYMYVIGGTTGYEYSADVHRLDMRTGVWECKYSCIGNLDEPVGRYRHELGFDGEKIYILGGGTADEAFGFEVS